MTSQITERINSVRNTFDDWKVDAIVIGSASNRRWLSGFSGSAGWLLLSRDAAIIGTDSRYWEQMRSQAPEYALHQLGGSFKKAFPKFVRQDGIKRIGIEADQITLAQFSDFEAVEDIEWVLLEKGVTPFREVKDTGEIEKVRHAAQITDQAMEQVPHILKPGMTEKELAWKLEVIMREAGADEMAFPIIAASGPNGAMAHHTPGDRPIQTGDPLIVDMGAKVNGYCGDLTRSFFVGDGDRQRFEELYAIVLEAQQAAIAGINAGMMGDVADALAREIISAAGYGPEFGHSLGHGIGLEVHEGPRLSKLAFDQPIPAGSMVTIEPGIYIAGWGGIRIEDLVLVTENGCEHISACEKNPYIR